MKNKVSTSANLKPNGSVLSKSPFEFLRATLSSSNGSKGFTIVESLVSVAILLLAITGAASAMQTGISSYIFSKNQIIAFYLAQEGFEQIRNIRDENGLEGEDWLNGISANVSDPCFFGNACTVDPINSNVPTRCGGGPGSCPVLRQNASTGFFSYNSSWPATTFRREIILTQINADEVSVSVTINWSKGLVNRQFEARENLLNWQ